MSRTAPRFACWTRLARSHFRSPFESSSREPSRPRSSSADRRGRTTADPALARDSRGRLASGHRALAKCPARAAGAPAVHADDSRNRRRPRARGSRRLRRAGRRHRGARDGARSGADWRIGGPAMDDPQSPRARSIPPISRPTSICWRSSATTRTRSPRGCEQVDPSAQDRPAQRRRRLARDGTGAARGRGRPSGSWLRRRLPRVARGGRHGGGASSPLAALVAADASHFDARRRRRSG